MRETRSRFSEMAELLRTVGGYELIRKLGRGGMATVYLARQPELDRHVALKELHAFHADDDSAAKRFLRESRVSGSLSHPNIVMVFDYLEHDGKPYIAMEYLEPGSLRAYLPALTDAQRFGILEGVLAALHHAELYGIVHRDLKPENVLVTGGGAIKLTDFGIAKATHELQSTMLTGSGLALGTPGYMAPEQAMAQPVGPSTDLYSVGCMAYEMFTGRLPFADSESPMALLLRHLNETIPPARTVNPALDPAISAWIAKLLARRPEDRFQSAEAAWDELEDIAIATLGPRWRRQAPIVFTESQSAIRGPYTPPPDAGTPMHPSIAALDEQLTERTPVPDEIEWETFAPAEPIQPPTSAEPEPEPTPGEEAAWGDPPPEVAEPPAEEPEPVAALTLPPREAAEPAAAAAPRSRRPLILGGIGLVAVVIVLVDRALRRRRHPDAAAEDDSEGGDREAAAAVRRTRERDRSRGRAGARAGARDREPRPEVGGRGAGRRRDVLRRPRARDREQPRAAPAQARRHAHRRAGRPRRRPEGAPLRRSAARPDALHRPDQPGRRGRRLPERQRRDLRADGEQRRRRRRRAGLGRAERQLRRRGRRQAQADQPGAQQELARVRHGHPQGRAGHEDRRGLPRRPQAVRRAAAGLSRGHRPHGRVQRRRRRLRRARQGHRARARTTTPRG